MATRGTFLDKKYGAYGHRNVPQEDKELTHIGAGSPAGEYLRRFWQPVAFTAPRANTCAASGSP